MQQNVFVIESAVAASTRERRASASNKTVPLSLKPAPHGTATKRIGTSGPLPSAVVKKFRAALVNDQRFGLFLLVGPRSL
jgi:hypothetical protein